MRMIAKALVFSFGLAHNLSVLAAETEFQVVVNQANEMTTIDHKFLADIFFKRATRWPNSAKISPVDLDANSRVRAEFSDEILNRPVSAVRVYWQQLIFSGRDIPPPELRNDKEVIDFVSSREDAIGYVSIHADVHRIKVVQVR